MPEPISTEDLYGVSRPTADEPVAKTLKSTHPMPIEETPEIVMNTVPPPAPSPKMSFGGTVGTIFIFLGLFGLGIWLSSLVRQYVPGGETSVGQRQVATLSPTPAALLSDPYASWKPYQVVSGTTKLPIDGMAFKLPPDVLSPICDGVNCASWGTYLPGGTRFTVAPRGIGQVLADFRGKSVSDAGGVVFTVKNATVSGHKAQEFTGVFTGQTVSGYAFSRMRGFMIEVSLILSLEINHFTPSGITADFAADDTLFDQIVKTLTLATPSATAK